MPHIHTQPGHHDHTASIYVFRTDSSEPKVVLHRHKKLNKYLQFGGHVELHETPWQAVVHELKEEAGYDIDQLELLQPADCITKLTDAVVHPQPVSHSTHAFGNGLDHFHTDVAYAATTIQEPRHQPDEGESKEIRLFSRHELAELSPDDIPENVREIGLFIFDTLLDTWQPLPARTYR